MRIGISLSSSLQHEPPAVVTSMVERATAAYRSGFTSLSVGDHHAQRAQYMQNTPTLGRLLAHWPDRPAGCLFLLPLWHPVLVAEHVGTLAAMVDAPFIVQTGIGSGRAQFAAFGARMETRGAVTDEMIRVVQDLLAGRSAGSERLGVAETSIGLRPTGDVEWWIGGHAEASLARAANLGTAWYGGPNLSVAETESLIDRYRRHGEEAGVTPRSIVRRDVLVLEDGDRARAAARSLVDAGYRGIDLDRLVVGDPDDAAVALGRLADVGCDDVIVRCMTSDQADALETIEGLGSIADRL